MGQDSGEVGRGQGGGRGGEGGEGGGGSERGRSRKGGRPCGNLQNQVQGLGSEVWGFRSLHIP